MTRSKKIMLPIIITFALAPCFVSAGEWGVGAAIGYFQPPHKGIDGQFLAVPYFTYQGEHLNVDLGMISFTVFQSEQVKISMEGELRFEGYKAKDSPELSGMDKRNPSFDAGIGVARMTMGGEVKFVVLGDITGTHDGVEARVQYQIPYMVNNWMIAPAVGVSHLNSALVDYYYGVKRDEVTNNRAYYAGNSTTNPYAELALGYALTNHVELTGGLKLTSLGKEITASPIVDRSYDTSAFSALQYKF